MSPERVYRLLLRAYPRTFRAEYGEQMTLVFRDKHRSRDARALAFWVSMLADVARSAPSMWVDRFSSLAKDFTRIAEVVMKLAGILAILLGIYGVVGALGDAIAGMRVGPSGLYVVAISLGIVAAMLLLIAGAAAWRSSASAKNMISITLVGSLIMVLIARLLHPWMGTLALIVGIVSPIALLATVQWPRRDHSTA